MLIFLNTWPLNLPLDDINFKICMVKLPTKLPTNSGILYFFILKNVHVI